LKDIPSISVQEEVGVMYDNGSVRISKNQGLIPRAGNVVFLKCSGAEVPKCVWVDQTGQIVKKTTIWFNRRYFNNDDAVIKLQSDLEARLKVEIQRAKIENDRLINQYQREKQAWDNEI
jgi:hypothetical protein